MKQILNKAFKGIELNETDIFKVVDLINNDLVSNEQVSALLGAISAKNGSVTSGEIASFAKCLKKYSKNVSLKSNKGFIDVCGTGGDCLSTFNISTAVSFIVASYGVSVIKHGARSVSSKCGSADVLEELGVNIDIKQENMQDVLTKTNMLFLYAPNFNHVMAKIKKIRNALGVPTIFNLLGPIINPVELDFQIVGIFDGSKSEAVIESLKHLGLKQAMVVHSLDGMDELSTTSDNIVYHLKNGEINKIQIPSLDEIGLKKAYLEDIKGGDKKENAQIILNILNGQKGPKTDIVLLNAAAGLIVCGIADDFYDGVQKAKQAIDSKAALRVLEDMKKCF